MEGTTVTFPLDGDYRYEVFQVPDEETTDPDEGIKVEEGKLEFNETIDELPSLTINYTGKVYVPSTTAS